jgi:hypothetical protein
VKSWVAAPRAAMTQGVGALARGEACREAWKARCDAGVGGCDAGEAGFMWGGSADGWWRTRKKLR